MEHGDHEECSRNPCPQITECSQIIDMICVSGVYIQFLWRVGLLSRLEALCPFFAYVRELVLWFLLLLCPNRNQRCRCTTETPYRVSTPGPAQCQAPRGLY
jgi:hypothetical protein